MKVIGTENGYFFVEKKKRTDVVDVNGDIIPAKTLLVAKCYEEVYRFPVIKEIEFYPLEEGREIVKQITEKKHESQLKVFSDVSKLIQEKVCKGELEKKNSYYGRELGFNQNFDIYRVDEQLRVFERVVDW